MVDIEIVKENYRRMHDEQLKRFARLEADNLPLESFHALKAELESRNIDLDIIEQLDDVDIPQKRAENAITEAYVGSLFDHAIDEKAKGTSDADIYQQLLAKQINPQQALMIIRMLKSTALTAIKEVETDISVGWISFIIGLALTIFFFDPPGIKLIVGIIIIIGASIRLAKSYAYKKKLLTAIENSANDEGPAIKGLYE